ncbi:MAG TPA: hypothetical protein VFD54_04185 [Anaerolineales bacterium]|jgi:hypothetical protein|nr:hypothetical protein [Anaerolineales bacterium]
MARTILNLPLIVFVISSVFFNSMLDTPMVKAGNILPDFRDFAQPVENGDVNTLSGVYVPNVLALPVIQQPSGDDGYVSNKDDQTTQFAMASQFGSVGLLAHNYLSGRFFSELAVGQEVRLVYGNGRVEYFVITEILRYQALEPNSQLSSFRSLDHSEILSAEQMFKRVYAGERHVTFQTCIAANGTVSWGRLFVVAEPKQFSFDHLVEQILQ